MVKLAAAGEETEPAITKPVVPVMVGTHFSVLDEKGRIIIPAKLRQSLTEQFWMMLDENNNIGIYNHQTGLDVMEYGEAWMKLHPEDEEAAAAVGRFTANAELVTVEGGWRVAVPDVLRYYAELDKNVVTVGQLNHAVLWDRERWEQSVARRDENAEVRRMQGMLMRAGASGALTQIAPSVPAINEAVTGHEQQFANAGRNTGDAAGHSAGTGNVTGAGDAAGAAVASAGHGGRSNRILALSQLGR